MFENYYIMLKVCLEFNRKTYDELEKPTFDDSIIYYYYHISIFISIENYLSKLLIIKNYIRNN